MLDGFTRGRTLTLGVSCLLHLGLVVTLLLAERWVMSAFVSKPPVLAIELVTPEEAPPPEPPPPQKPPPRAVPPRPITLPKPVETPLPRMAEIVEKPLPEPRPAAPDPPAVTRTIEPAPAASESAPARPSGAASPAPSGAVAPQGPPEATVAGRSAGPAPPASSIAAAPSRESGSAGAVTQYARPQGGYQVRPSYPSTARRLGIQGTTLLKVHVLIDGRVGDVVVQDSAGHPELDQAAADAVRRWRFDPARRGDEPVAMWVLLPVEFRLSR